MDECYSDTSNTVLLDMSMEPVHVVEDAALVCPLHKIGPVQSPIDELHAILPDTTLVGAPHRIAI